MGLFDKLRRHATDVADKHGDKIAQGIDKGVEAADRRTSGKHSRHLRTGADKAKQAVDDLGSREGDDRGPSGGEQGGGTAAPRRDEGDTATPRRDEGDTGGHRPSG